MLYSKPKVWFENLNQATLERLKGAILRTRKYFYSFFLIYAAEARTNYFYGNFLVTVFNEIL